MKHQSYVQKATGIIGALKRDEQSVFHPIARLCSLILFGDDFRPFDLCKQEDRMRGVTFILAGSWFFISSFSTVSAKQLPHFNIGAGAKVGWLNLSTPDEQHFGDTPLMGIFLTAGTCYLALELAGEYSVAHRNYMGAVNLLELNHPTEMLDEKLTTVSALGTLRFKVPLDKKRIILSVGIGLGAYGLEGEITGRESRDKIKSSDPRIGCHFGTVVSRSLGESFAGFLEVKYREVSGAGILPCIPLHVVARNGMKMCSVSVGLLYYLL